MGRLKPASMYPTRLKPAPTYPTTQSYVGAGFSRPEDHDQKSYFTPNCMMRGRPACVVMRPNVPALRFVSGSPQLK